MAKATATPTAAQPELGVPVIPAPGRSMWKGAIVFGLLSVPIKLYTAHNDRDVSFNRLHEQCKGRIQLRNYCPACDVEVDKDELLRAYETSKGQYVEIRDEDLEDLPLPSLHTLKLEAFVDASEIDPLHYLKGYYVQPEPLGVRAYAVLQQALERNGVVAVARITIRSKESLAALSVGRHGDLALYLLRDADEIRAIETITPQVLTEQEQDLADLIVASYRKPFNAAEYPDHQRAALMERLAQRVAGATPLSVVESAPQAPPMDLMAQLHATLAQIRATQPTPEPTPITKARARRKTG
jgi:DNA end-binding protein Ku